jgi:hypothetical protein
MQLRFFTVSVHGGDETAAEVNRFLTGHRILAIDRQLVSTAKQRVGDGVSFDDGTMRRRSEARQVDYKDVLTEPEFASSRAVALRRAGRR